MNKIYIVVGADETGFRSNLAVADCKSKAEDVKNKLKVDQKYLDFRYFVIEEHIMQEGSDVWCLLTL